MSSADLVAAIANLNSAADELRGAAEGVADSIESAVQNVEEAAGQFDLEEEDGSRVDLDDLVEAVVRLHDTEHEGAMRWCGREACRLAHELLPPVAVAS